MVYKQANKPHKLIKIFMQSMVKYTHTHNHAPAGVPTQNKLELFFISSFF